MSTEKTNEGFEELDFDISKVVADPKPVLPKLEVDGDDPQPDPVPDPDPQPDPEPKRRGRPKKVDPEPAPDPDPDPTPDPDSNPDPDPEPALFQSLAKSLGIELAEGEEYEETEEGLTTFVQSASDKIADAKLNGWLESLPPVASDFFDYLQMLGEEATEENVKKFFTSVNPEIDYKSVDLNNEDAQKAIMRTFYKKMDYTEDEVKEALEDLEIAGTLAKSAKIASAKLAAKQEDERAALVQQQREADAKKRESVQKYWNSVDSTIKSGKVHNFNIPVTEQKALLDYMAKPTKSGVPQLQEDLNAMSVEDRIALAVAVKNKFNLQKYITTAVKTAQANSLRERLGGNSTKLKGGVGARGAVDDEISFEVK